MDIIKKYKKKNKKIKKSSSNWVILVVSMFHFNQGDIASERSTVHGVKRNFNFISFPCHVSILMLLLYCWPNEKYCTPLYLTLKFNISQVHGHWSHML